MKMVKRQFKWICVGSSDVQAGGGMLMWWLPRGWCLDKIVDDEGWRSGRDGCALYLDEDDGHGS